MGAKTWPCYNQNRVIMSSVIKGVKCLGKEKRPFCCRQNFVPNGLSVPARGYIHVVKRGETWKNVYKIGLQSNFF